MNIHLDRPIPNPTGATDPRAPMPEESDPERERRNMVADWCSPSIGALPAHFEPLLDNWTIGFTSRQVGEAGQAVLIAVESLDESREDLYVWLMQQAGA